MVSYPARQRLRRLRRAAAAAAGCVLALAVAAALAGAGSRSLSAVSASAAIVLAASCRRWLQLARRSGIGARSEAEVRRALHALEHEGWRVRHALPWHGGGDIDHVAIAPASAGVAFVVETKTRTYTAAHLARTVAIAAWLTRRRRGWCPRGATPVLCVVRARGLQTTQAGVLVLSLDRLVPALRTAAGNAGRPALLACEPGDRT